MIDPWRPETDPAWIAALGLAAVDYAVVARRSARRGAPVPGWRVAAFGCGLAIVAAALLSPIEHLALHSMLLFHLLQNVMIADWAPPLLVLGLTPAMAAAAERWAAVRSATSPVPALALWLAVWYGLHVPAFYDYALRHTWALGLEHVLFIAAGLAFWWPVVQPGRMSAGARVAYLFGAFFLAAPVALVIALAGSPLYDFYRSTPKLWGLSALGDQQLAGMLMAIEQAVLLFAAFSLAFHRLIAEDAARPEDEGVVSAP